MLYVTERTKKLESKAGGAKKRSILFLVSVEAAVFMYDCAIVYLFLFYFSIFSSKIICLMER
jgi:hypothetical protein